MVYKIPMSPKEKRLQTISRGLLLLTIAVPLILIFAPFATAILVAVFVALAIEPILGKISSKAKRKKYFAASLALFMSVFFLLPASLFTIRVVDALKTLSNQSMKDSRFFNSLFDLWDIIKNNLLKAADTFGVDPSSILSRDELFSAANQFVVEKARILVSAVPQFGLALFVFFSFLILFTTNGDSVKKFFINSNLLPADEIDHITNTLKSGCNFILVSTLVIGALQALIVSVGSVIFGHNEFLLIFIFTFFLSFIPVVGAAPVALVLSLISFINGNAGQGIGMAVVAVFAGTIDNFLKPFIFSGKSKNLHPLVSLFGIIGAIIVFGLPGLLLGPLILQIALELGPPLVKKLFN